MYRVYTAKEINEMVARKYYNAFIMVNVDGDVNYAPFDFVNFTVRNDKYEWQRLIDWFNDNHKHFMDVTMELRVYKDNEERMPLSVQTKLTYAQYAAVKDTAGIDILQYTAETMVTEMLHFLLSK